MLEIYMYTVKFPFGQIIWRPFPFGQIIWRPFPFGPYILVYAKGSTRTSAWFCCVVEETLKGITETVDVESGHDMIIIMIAYSFGVGDCLGLYLRTQKMWPFPSV